MLLFKSFRILLRCILIFFFKMVGWGGGFLGTGGLRIKCLLGGNLRLLLNVSGVIRLRLVIVSLIFCSI